MTYWILGSILYFLIGLIVTRYTPFGKDYFPNNPIRLTLFRIFPVFGLALFYTGIMFGFTYFFGMGIFMFGALIIAGPSAIRSW